MDQKPQLIVLNSASDCIDIHLLDGKGYIFHTQDAFALQYGRRIHADWIGSMPLHPNQSVWLTLPCVLSPEHIYVGLIEGFMRCWRHDLGRKPTLEQVQRHEYHRKMVAQQQSMEIEQISAQMRKKHLVGSNSSENEKSTPGVEDNPPTLTYLPSLLTWDSLASDQPDNPQSPSTLPLEEFLSSLSTRERNRSLVYHDLWKKGYHITNGVKFGGDFLVYKGRYMDIGKFCMIFISLDSV
eukprot:TRINITY_DN7120_c0_g1_i2.p1 TRINITY_DN7120_c0_g1~~TRINITY_DN7120_c0_g1_i2.p1  ORF type:complete len:239 (-),score=36.39 TRINITY_DN7120_c0_g1_i2:51-767(-)